MTASRKMFRFLAFAAIPIAVGVLAAATARAVVYTWDTIPGIGLVSNTPVTMYAGSAWGQYTVATLPSCTSVNKGRMLEVTDATTPTYNGALTGGGTALVPVVCSGTAWTSH